MQVTRALQRDRERRLATGLGVGLAIGTLGGLIGLGGAEFRLPVLITLFGFAALQAVILNKAISLVVVTSALVFRSQVVAVDAVVAHWPTVLNLLAGTLVGAWFGADLATRLNSATLYRVIAVLLLPIAAILAFGHDSSMHASPLTDGVALVLTGLILGVAIGVVASLLGVAGGEFLIPTLVLVFGVDVKLAGSMALVISLPTILAGFARYSRDASFAVLRSNSAFVICMASGSVIGTLLGAQLLAVVPTAVLLPLLAALLVISSIKLWRHR